MSTTQLRIIPSTLPGKFAPWPPGWYWTGSMCSSSSRWTYNSQDLFLYRFPWRLLLFLSVYPGTWILPLTPVVHLVSLIIKNLPSPNLFLRLFKLSKNFLCYEIKYLHKICLQNRLQTGFFIAMLCHPNQPNAMPPSLSRQNAKLKTYRV